ncbi:MAG TPA: outer membrane protein assembly factor BamD [Candidatus Omnitrophota bacterium]|nr:outer membrane protein assembly factor BamD [Candidatus Omnitrophota bacterium]
MIQIRRISGVLLLSFPLILFPVTTARADFVWSSEKGRFVREGEELVGNADEQYAYAMGFYEKKKYEQAIQQFQKLVKAYPSSKVAPDAQFKLGELYEESGDYYKAFHAYQKVISNYPQSAQVETVIERQFRIGNLFLSGKRSKFMGMPIMPALPKAIEVFEQVVTNAPFGKYGDQALFKLGTAYRKSGNLNKALETFERLAEDYPDSQLVADAKFQLGEISFQMAKNVNRSVEGLDRAEAQFNSFIQEYPDTSVAEKARQLKQAIDEKNAQKNFDIAQYYEKENRLDSALIYYEDIAAHYPMTSWGKKAKEKILFFQAPEKFIKAKEKAFQTELSRIEQRIKDLNARLSILGEGEKEERKSVEGRLKQLKKKERHLKGSLHDFEKRKVSDIKRRFESLKIKEQELAEKKRALQARKKQMRGNPSEDLARFFQSWSESLEAEEAALQKEKTEVERIRRELGIPSGFSIPFFRREDPFEKARSAYLQDIAKLIEEYRAEEIRREDFESVLKEVSGQAETFKEEDIELMAQKKEFQEALEESGGDLKKKQQALEEHGRQIDSLKKTLDAREIDFRKQAEANGWTEYLRDAGSGARAPLKLEGLDRKGLEAKLEKTKRKAEKLSARIEEKRRIVETLQKGFSEELGTVPVAGGSAPQEISGEEGIERLPEQIRLKKKMRLTEREIRWRYDEIRDRNGERRNMIDELEKVMKETDEKRWGGLEKTGKIAAAPAVGTYKFFKAFIFGLTPKEESVSRQAEEMTKKDTGQASARILELRENIEVETLLIEARTKEVDELKSEFEKMKEESSKYANFSYRTIFVELPGVSLQKIVKTAKGVFVNTGRSEKEALQSNLDKRNARLKKLEERYETLQEQVKALEAKLTEVNANETGRQETEKENGPSPEAQALLKEIEDLKDKISVEEASFEKERKTLRKELRDFYERNVKGRMKERFSTTDRDLGKRKALFSKERAKAEKELRKVVDEEKKIVIKHEKLLMKRREVLKKNIERLKKKSDYRYEILENDLEELSIDLKAVVSEKNKLMQERERIPALAGPAGEPSEP